MDNQDEKQQEGAPGAGEGGADVTAAETAATGPVDQDSQAGDDQQGAAPVEASDDTNQLLLVVEKLRELGLEPDGDYLIGETAAIVLGQQAEKLALLDGERSAAIARAEKAEEQLAAEAAKPKAVAARGGAKPRKISAKAVKSPVQPKTDTDGNAISVASQLQELIGMAETVEIVCSDGELEITAIPPQRITGGAWRITPVGLQLQLEQLLVTGPAPGAPATELRGYGLLLDGELVHYQPRGDVMELAGGSTSNIAPDVCLS